MSISVNDMEKVTEYVDTDYVMYSNTKNKRKRKILIPQNCSAEEKETLKINSLGCDDLGLTCYLDFNAEVWNNSSLWMNI